MEDCTPQVRNPVHVFALSNWQVHAQALACTRPRQHEPAHLVVCVEWMPLRAALIEHHTQCPHVALLVVGLVLAELGRQVVRRAHDGLGKVGVCAQNLQGSYRAIY